MQIHQLKPNKRLSKKKRVGRGGKRGTYSGRGMKGQKSRAGAKIKPQIKELISKFPKKRGRRFKTIKKEVQIIQLKDIVKSFPEGGIINPFKLKKAKLIKNTKNKFSIIRILGAQPLSSKFIIKNCLVSQKVRQVIEKSGGKIIEKFKKIK